MFLVCRKPQRFKAVERWCPGINLRISKGSDEENEAYCTKPETRLSPAQEVGDRRVLGQGARTDIMTVSDAIVGGADYDRVADLYPLAIMKWSKGIRALIASRTRHRDRMDPPLVICFFGGAGIGKTWSVYDIVEKKGYKTEDLFRANNLKWWDGYKQQRFVLIDEVDKLLAEDRGAGFKAILDILDKYPVNVEVKGDFVKFNSPVIFLCATVAPRQWVLDTGSQANQIERRIHHCYTRYAQGEKWEEVPMWKPVVVKKEPEPPVVIDLEDDEIQVVGVEDDPDYIQCAQGSPPMTPTLLVPEPEDEWDIGELPFFD